MPGPVYNFYNCCCDGGSSGGEVPTAPAASVFPIKTINGNLQADWVTGDIDRARPHQFRINQPNGQTEIFTNLEAYPFAYRLRQLAIVKQLESGSTAETMNMDLVVMDFAGNALRTVSAQPVGLVGLASDVWVPVPLVADPVALEIRPGEVVIQRCTISAVVSDNWRCNAYLSGLAEMV